MSEKKLEYDFADRAWQPILGCDNTIACWKNCWAKRVVSRLSASPNMKVAAAHAGLVQMSGPYRDVLTWTGDVRINEAHLEDPLKWHKPSVIATGFHGDWGLLPQREKDRMFAVMAFCYWHRFFPLVKHNLRGISDYLDSGNRVAEAANEMACKNDKITWLPCTLRVKDGVVVPSMAEWPIPNVNIGVSVMTQTDADAALPHIRRIAEAGWKVHCWHEPAIGPVDWRGWQFLSWLVVGGQSAGDAPFDLQWARDAIAWGCANNVPVKIKQLGSNPVDRGFGARHLVADRRGANWECWPDEIKVRQMPEVNRAL